MEIEVQDIYAQSETGSKIHFDVMLSIEGDEPTEKNKAQEFVQKISEISNTVELENIQFCHTKRANPEVGEIIVQEGYCIDPIENCPDPF